MKTDLGLSLTSLPVLDGGSAASPPSPSIARLVFEGDSRTSRLPDTPESFYPYAFADAHPGVTVYNRAQGSRVLDTDMYAGGANGAVQQEAIDLACNPDALPFWMGVNDTHYHTLPASDYLGAIKSYFAPIRASGCKCFLATEILIDPTTQPSLAHFLTFREDFNAAVRASVGDGFDALIPFGDHPDLTDPAQWPDLTSDGVHPNASGQDMLAAVFEAVMRAPLEGRASGVIYPDVTFGSNVGNQPPGAVIKRRMLIAGLGMGVAGSFSLSGAGFTWRRGYNGDEYGIDSYDDVYDGDIIELRGVASDTAGDIITAAVDCNGQTRTLSITTAARGTFFAPDDLGIALFGLFDATDASSVTTASGLVASWASGYGAAMALGQGNAGLRPGYASGVSVNFVPSNLNYLIPSGGPGADFIMLTISIPAAQATANTRTLTGRNASALNMMALLSGATQALYYDGSNVRNFGFTLAGGTRVLTTARYASGAAPRASRDGNVLSAGPTSLSNVAIDCVGGFAGNAEGWGDINMIAFLDGATSDADRQKMEGWMVWRLVDAGIAADPSDLLNGSHPYVSARP